MNEQVKWPGVMFGFEKFYQTIFVYLHEVLAQLIYFLKDIKFRMVIYAGRLYIYIYIGQHF